MKKRVIFIAVLLTMVLLTGTAIASSWQFSYSSNDRGDKINYYYETTTLTRSSDGKNFMVWTDQVWEYHSDKSNPTRDIMYYNEVTIASPHYRRIVEDYGYDASRNELWHNKNTSQWYYVEPGSSNDAMFNTALRYLN